MRSLRCPTWIRTRIQFLPRMVLGYPSARRAGDSSVYHIPPAGTSGARSLSRREAAIASYGTGGLIDPPGLVIV